MLVCAVAAGAFASPALAANVNFTGQVKGTCTLTVDQQGQLGVNADLTQLSSLGTGGQVGQVSAVTSTDLFKISIQAPTAWTSQPATYTETSAFEAKLADTAGNKSTRSLDLPQGNSTTDVELKATTPANTVFAVGDYAATVVVTCD